jgi:hypothetical protein
MIGCVFFKLESWFHLLGLWVRVFCLRFIQLLIYVVLGPCALPLLSRCVWFLLDMRCFSVFCFGWLHVGVKTVGGPHRILYAYILVDVIKAPVLEFCFGCFKIKVLCVLLVGDMWV